MADAPGFILIIGAGCIGRGLLAPLVAAAGHGIVFVEANPAFAAALRRAGRYCVRSVGLTTFETEITPFVVLDTTDGNAIHHAVRECRFAATCVGGANLPHVPELLASGLSQRVTPLNVLVCENWPDGAGVLSRELAMGGIAGTGVSAIPCSVERMVKSVPNSLDLIGESNETLWFDRTRWQGDQPSVAGLTGCDDVTPYYYRKLYLNNLGHAVLAYLGALCGCRYVHEALDVPDIRTTLVVTMERMASALVREYGFTAAELDRHIEGLLSCRFGNRELADPVERVARDPLRKLGPHERLLGALRLSRRYDLPVTDLQRVAAAALHYAVVCEATSMARGDTPEALLRTGTGMGVTDPDYAGIMREFEKINREAQ